MNENFFSVFLLITSDVFIKIYSKFIYLMFPVCSFQGRKKVWKIINEESVKSQNQHWPSSIKLESIQELFNQTESIWERLNQIRVKTGMVQSNQSQNRNGSIKSESIQELFKQIRVKTGIVQSN